jgi:transcriptional regulator with XRE-family HTH domain
MASLGSRLRLLRLEYNLTLRQLSALSGISTSALHAYEIGTRNPKREALESLADVFNCDKDYLEGRTNIRNRVANSIGYSSLAEAHAAYKEKVALTESDLDEGERAWIELYRKLSPDVQETFVTMVKTFDSLPEGERQMLLAMIRGALGSQAK